MRSKIIYVLIIIFCISCKSEAEKLDAIIDRKLEECYKQNNEILFSQIGFELNDRINYFDSKKSIHNEFEKYLLQKGILKNISKKSYLEIFKKIESINYNEISITEFQEKFTFSYVNLFSGDGEFGIDSSIHCLYSINNDFELFDKNNWRQKYLNEIGELIQLGNEEINLQVSMEKIMNLIPDEKFKKQFYRCFIIASVHHSLEYKLNEKMHSRLHRL